MTRDRDFKQHVRDRAVKTGQSYQAARQTMSGPTERPVPGPTGEAEVREMFRIPDGRWVGGCVIRSGEVNCWDQARVIRDGVVVGEGPISSLRTYKKPVPRVSTGQQCGIFVVDVDLQVGDLLAVAATGTAVAAQERLAGAVLDATAQVSGQTREAIQGPSRSQAVVRARQDAMYVMDYVGVRRSVIAETFDRPIAAIHRGVESLEGQRGQQPDVQARIGDVLGHLDALLAAQRALLATEQPPG